MVTAGEPPGQQDWFGAHASASELRARAISGVASLTLRRALVQGINFASTLLLARLLLPEDFGLIAMAAAVTGLAALFKDMGLSAATVRYASISARQISNLFWLNVLASLLLFVAIVAAAPLMAAFYKEPRAGWVATAMAVGIVLDSTSVQHRALLTRAMRFDLSMRIGVASTLASCAVAIASAAGGLGYWALVLAGWAASVTSAIQSWRYCDWRPGPPRRHAGTRPLVAFGMRNFASNLMAFLATNLHTVIVGRLGGAAAAGLYNRAFSTQRLFLHWVELAPRRIMPVMLAAAAAEPARLASYYYRSCTLVVMAGLPIMFVGLALPHELLSVVFGPRWLASGDALQMLAIGTLPQMILGTSGWIYLSVGAPERMLRFGAMGWGILIAGTLVGSLYFAEHGIKALALGSSAALALWVWPGMRYAFGGTALGWPTLWRHIRGPIVAGLGAGAGAWLLLTRLPLEPAVARLLAGCCAFAALDLLLLVTVTGQRAVVGEALEILKKVVKQARAGRT